MIKQAIAYTLSWPVYIAAKLFLVEEDQQRFAAWLIRLADRIRSWNP
jgi:acetone carboxylase gamma subunit